MEALVKGVGHGVKCPLKMVREPDVMNELKANCSMNLDLGSNTCPIVSEAKGLVGGDMSATGLLALYSLSAGAAVNANVKIGVSSFSKGVAATSIAALGTAPNCRHGHS